MSFFRKIKRLLKVFRHYGVPGVLAYLRARRFTLSEAAHYQTWLERKEKEAGAVQHVIEDWTNRPLISVVLPVYNVGEKWLRKCLDSVIFQSYSNWELCIADDASTAPHIRPLLKAYESKDARIKVVFRDTNGHISAASNSALEIATGEFCVLLDHDDELSPDALFWVANEINEHPEAAMIFSDEDLIDEHGHRSRPLFKPDFSRDLLYSLNLVTHLSAYRTSVFKEIGGFRIGLEGSQDYDLALRVVEGIDGTQIRHISKILYHWRAIPGSVALDGDEKPYAHERARRAIREHFARTGVNATVEKTHFNLHRVRYAMPGTPPTISVVFWSDESRRDVSAVDVKSLGYSYAHVELIEAEPSAPLAESLNAAVESASGEIIVFLRRGLETISESPLSELVRFVLQPSLGCVGGIVLGNDGTIQAGGIVLGGNDIMNVAHAGLPEHMPGNMVRNLVTSNFSAVCLDVFATRRDVFGDVGGFDSRFSDEKLMAADLCLRIRMKELRTVLTPYAKFACLKSHDRRKRTMAIEERNYFLSKWSQAVDRDPFSNPNLSNDGRFFIEL